MKEEILREIGLTDKEITIYLTLLRLGSASVQEVAKKANSHRPYTYDVLNSLSSKGFATYTIKRGRKFFEAAEPKKLMELMYERQKKIEDILPELEAMYKSTIKKPAIEIYEKKEGLKTLLQKVINNTNEYAGIGNHENFAQYFEFYSDVFVKRRIEKGVKVKYIFEESKNSRELTKRNKKELRETKNIPKLNGINAEFWTFNDTTIFFTTVENEPLGIEIQNKEIAGLLKTLFQIIWDKQDKEN